MILKSLIYDFLGQVILNSNDMNDQLTKKERKAKRIEARQRAILWSEREIRKKQLKNQSRIQHISLSEPPASAPNFSRQSDLNSRQSDLISRQSNNENTVSSLQRTIRDLTIQRQEPDITIKVLTNHLNQLLSNQKPKSKRSKTDGH